MKKLFVAVLAVAALASCAQEDVILNNNKAITFGDAYVQNSTKAIFEGANEVQAFQVWGTVTPAGDGATALPLYEGATVTRGTAAYGEAWSCNVQRFWTPNCDYAFYAVVDASVKAGDDGKIAPNANVEATGGVPTAIKYTANGQNDLLYGATTKTTKTDLVQPTTPLVAFTMQHLLSKVSFKFTNTNTNTAYDYKVTKVEVLGAYTNGTYTITHAAGNIDGKYFGSWAGTGKSETALSFLNENTPLVLADATVSGDNVTASTTVAPKSFVIIPGKPELEIAIEVQTVFNSKVVSTQPYTLTVNGTDGKNQIEFAKNTHYNFVVALEGGKPIDFTIGSVGDFSTPATGGDVTIQ